jgi:hypothetical protein
VSSFHKHSVSATVIGCNSNGFIQKLVKMFDADGFVISFCCEVKSNVEEEANLLEETLEDTAIVDNGHAAETNFEEYILYKKASKVVGGSNVVSG